MLEADPAACAHAMGCAGGGVHTVERCVRVCVAHGGGCQHVSGAMRGGAAARAWGTGVGAAVLGGCKDAGVSPPTYPPLSLRLPIPLSPFPTAATGRRVVALPRPVPALAACCSTAPPPGEGSTALGKGPSAGPGWGQQWGWERGSSSCAPVPQGTLQPCHPWGHRPGCMRVPRRLGVLAPTPWPSSQSPHLFLG